MAQQYKLGSYATKIKKEGEITIITYHNTDIVKFNDKFVILNNGGHKTTSTKDRMNQASHQFKLGYTIFQKKGTWYIDYHNEEWKYYNGIKLSILK